MRNFVLIWLFLFYSETCAQTCSRTVYYTTKDRTKCKLFGWWRCSKYRIETRLHYDLCEGWTQADGAGGANGFLAICAGRTNLNGACHRQYNNDKIIHRNGSIETQAANTHTRCTSPNHCENCNKGFYNDGSGYCTICPKIDYCNYRDCTSTADNHCEWCEGDIKPKKSWRAFIPNKSGKVCQKACSWRQNSTRCFPGSCEGELVSNCTCWKPGFSGDQCTTITKDVDVLYAEVKLTDPFNTILTAPVDPNEVMAQTTRWTNKVNWQIAELKLESRFNLGKAPDHDPDGIKHFVTDFKYGIINVTMKLIHVGGGTESTKVVTLPCHSNENRPLYANICAYEKKANRTKAVQISTWQFRHGEKLMYQWIVKNGGYLIYRDRDTEKDIRISLKGRTKTASYTFQWDLMCPYHKCTTTSSKCTDSPVTTDDVTEQADVLIQWSGWEDDLAGIDHYEIDVFELRSDGMKLREDLAMAVPSLLNISSSQSHEMITLPSAGMYSVNFIAYDKAGNYRYSRCVVFYDDQSKVEHQPGKRTIVKQSSKETNYTWVTVPDKTLSIDWKDLFINLRHKQHNWLSAVRSLNHVEDVYDDHTGKRTVAAITNVHGVVRFEIKFRVHAPHLADQQVFTPIRSVVDQTGTIYVTWADGNRLDITVRAIDIFEKFTEDTITVYKDTSPPLINNLWLSRGDHVNISVHSIEDFSKMTIEWKAMDYDSGLDQVRWRLFDNYTGRYIDHGKADLHAQGMAQNLNHCKQKYHNEPRGPSCYCTMFHGCYHKHFYVKPKIVKDAGLEPGKDKGQHDSEYFIEVTVVNNALLQTTFIKKITIDVSPPHEGEVHDGIKGAPEVDYQQHRNLNAHWEGFFDRESGVEFYMYIFSDHCFSNREFRNSRKTKQTYNTFANYWAPKEGTYFLSVVAVNRAKENSNVVCSDGVTITTAVPYINNFILEGSRTIARLIKNDHGTVWLLDSVLQIHLVQGPIAICRTTLMSSLSMFPRGKQITSLSSDICEGRANNLHILAVTPTTAQFKLSWSSAVNRTLIHDFEVGLSSTPSGIAPDIFPFLSSKHHTHFRLRHPDVPDGKEFYVVIKSISKSGTSGIQSVGPFIVDTTKPQFVGKQIDVKLDNGYLIANWSSGAFTDPDDPYPMKFEYSLGHQPHVYDIQQFRHLQYGGACKRITRQTCTAVSISSLKWSLHGHHEYYLTIKATNLAGLSVIKSSIKYSHDVQLPSKGVVFDVSPSSNNTEMYKDIEDIDFTMDRTSLGIKWYGFVHPHHIIRFRVCVGTKPKTCDVTVMQNVNPTDGKHIITSMSLTPFQKYHVTLEASTTAGQVRVSTDGVTVLDVRKNLTGIIVRDGTNCANPHGLQRTHHQQDTRPKCTEDIEFQTSTTTLHSYWTVPTKYDAYIRDTFLKVELGTGDYWLPYRDFEYVGRHRYATINDLDFKPGKTYRAVLKFCAEDLCFPVVNGNGVTVLVSPPVVGNISVAIQNVTNSEQLLVTFEKMRDPDVTDPKEACDIVWLYEWALGDNVGLHTVWNTIVTTTSVDNRHMQFIIPLNTSMDFSKCRKIFIRGYNKAGIWSAVSTEIKKCDVTKSDLLIVPNIVIDAIGLQEYSMDGVKRDGYGHDIFLEQNSRWKEPDVDYTPYKNILSATWPLLRHKNYTWSVIDAQNVDVTSYYKDESQLSLHDPCSHPDSIKCGHSVKEYINVPFRINEELEHGKRYLICMHAPRTKIEYEKWIEILDEVNTCSDGVTVDLTPPTPGDVWIGVDRTEEYQSSSSDIFVSWESFTDVEEYKQSVHTSGIKKYQIGIGSTRGGTDIAPYTDVGIVNHYTFHNLRLRDGHEYYATVKGFDFSQRNAIANSHPVKIDSTPPVKSEHPIKIEGRHMVKLSEINACWRDVFIDRESGIDHYLWAVGSHPGHDDIIQFTKTSLDCGLSSEDKNINVHEGHAYFITVKAVNRAKLITTASSWAYVYDMSPPVNGHVYDGSADTALSYRKDVDYQTDSRTLSSYWEGFHDPHSTIKSYYVRVGTCPGCQDVLTNQDIGISNNFTFCHIHLGPGIRYFTTITACNTADLCTTGTSDGVIVDNSPPTQGRVQDGVDVYDLEYQTLRNYISAKWYGFTDPQSGLDKFTWRVGTKPGSDDIVRSTSLPLTNILVEPDLPSKLPIGKRIYFTIKAYNKAGLSSEVTSNGFYIDESKPVIKTKPKLSRDVGSITDDSIVFRSTIKVTWGVEDKESYIERQYLSISSHKRGEFNTTSTELNGIVREFTFARLDLHDGGIYTVKLIACNGGKLCVEDESLGILIDSSPPTPGMFAIKTDHAANLHRDVDGWMTWSRYKLWLSWLGFSDIQTSIDRYYVSLGSQYMMDDLNKVSGSPQEFQHKQSGVNKHDEGYVQIFEVETKNMASFEHVFVSVWAVNTIGLQSRMIHSQFKLVPGGSLELIRRCSAITCLGHCVCAAQGRRCSLNGNKCTDLSKGNPNNLLGVYDITNLRSDAEYSDMKYTPSNVALAAKWQIIQAQGSQPLWYEWTAGLTIKDEPEGVFDNLHDEVWHHAGQTNMAVFNLKRGRILKEQHVSYSMFVRAWYSENTYADFKTDGLLILSRALARRKIRGSAVTEQIPDHWKKDVDYIKLGAPFTIRWTNVFIGDSQIMDRFKVYLSTFPGGHDIHVVDMDLTGSMTSYNISRVPLTPGITFYSNVVGYSLSGIHSTVTSDGIMVDSKRPTTGSVYDGIGIHDTEYQNSSDTVAASWHGFSDGESGITHYMWCVQTKLSSIPCNIRPLENTGIHRTVSRQLNGSIQSGTEIQSMVYAVDLIGHKSETKKSNGVIIDITHPEPTLMEHLDDNIALNPSFEDSHGDFIDWQNITDVNICTVHNNVRPLHWNISSGSCVGVLKSGKNVAMDGRSFVFIEGMVSQTIENLKLGQLYRVTFVTAHPPVIGAVLANKEGYITINDQKHVFMVYTKRDKYGSSIPEVNWHHHTFYFRATIKTATLSFGSMTGNTGILFDDIKVQQTVIHDHDDNEANGHHIHAHVVTLHQWSSVHASWSFVDPESHIVDYMWAIGYTEGSTEVQGFTSVGLSNFAYNYNVSLAHTSVIHITVVATNAAGLMREAHAEDLLVDLTPPKIMFVNDGIGSDITAQTTDEISANWDVYDEESGLEFCDWAVGYQAYGNEIQTFQKLPNGAKLISKVFPSNQLFMQMIHVTLRCRNTAGLQSIFSSNGVKISNLPPQTTDAEVLILPHSMTEYDCREHYQGDMSRLRVKWTGFKDIAGLDAYMLTLRSKGITTILSKSIIAEDQDMSYCILDGLNMEYGNITASVKAVNKMYLRSYPVVQHISLSSVRPHVTVKPDIKLSVDNRTVLVSWADHFTNEQPIFYEISAGTTLGGADIIQWQETKSQYIEFKLPPKIKTLTDLTSYISIRGVFTNGMDKVLNMAVKL